MTKRLTDAEIEALPGLMWNGDYWKIEDADLHPLVRTIESAVLERSKQAEPVIAYIVEGFEGNTVIAKHLSFEPQQAKDTASVFSQHYPTVSTRALYTTTPGPVNQQLLEALKRMLIDGNCPDYNYRTLAEEQARAAIAAAERGEA